MWGQTDHLKEWDPQAEYFIIDSHLHFPLEAIQVLKGELHQEVFRKYISLVVQGQTLRLEIKFNARRL
jgi:hypothetical protein